MKILFLSDSPLIRNGIATGFQELGHETIVYTRLSQLSHRAVGEKTMSIEEAVQEISHDVKQLAPDLLFTEQAFLINDVVFPVLESCGIPHVSWAIEDPTSVDFTVPWAERSVLTLTTCIEWVEEVYQPRNLPAICIPFGVNPSFHKRGVYREKLAHELSFVGNNYMNFPYRVKGFKTMLDPFIHSGHDIAVYGNWWWSLKGAYPYEIPEAVYHGYLDYVQIPDLCASSPFILGVNSIPNSKTMQAMRTFDVLGSAGFYLTHVSLAIETMFENHKHLVWSHSPEETMEQYEFYRKHPNLMEDIRKQGQQFVYQNHAYIHRAQQIINALPASLRN